MAVTAETRPVDSAPRLADGLELIGRLEGSGFKRPVYLARRSDGQVLQLSPLLYLLAEKADGNHDLQALAEEMSRECGRRLREAHVRVLVEDKLRPAGVLASPGDSSSTLERSRPLLALTFRVAVIQPGLAKALADLFRPLFSPPVMVAFVGALLGLDAWLFQRADVRDSAQQVAYEPGLLLALIGLVVLATAFHECGHAGACRYAGADPGPIGVGLYLVWPVFYADLTDTYRLSRRDRLRSDLGGIYFNVVFIVASGAAYLLTDFAVLIVLIVLLHYGIVLQLLPLLRFDGYYVLSDLTGVPDLMSRIRPTLLSLAPGKQPDPRVAELRPGVRVAVAVYVLVTVLALAAGIAMLVVNAPRILATALESFLLQLDRLIEALASADPLAGVLSLLQSLAAALPVVGLTLTLAMVVGRLHKAVRLLDGRPLLWPGPGRAATTIVWNILFDLSIALALASLVLAALGIAGAD